MKTSGDDLEREIQEKVEKLTMEGEEKVNSEQENTGEVKITKRFGIKGKWETLSQEELEQKVTEGEYRVMDTPDGSSAATPVNGNTAVKSGWHTVDLKQVVDDPNAEAESSEYYSSPEGMANLTRMEEEANNELFLEWQRDAEEYEIPQNDPAFDYLIGTAPGAIGQEGLFPMGEISLIAGPSGAGKTTFAVQLFQSWREGKTFLGRPVHPRQYQFITYDRRINSFRRTLHRMGLKEGDFEWKPLTPSYSQPLIDLIQQMWKADKKAEDVRVFLVEGLDLAAETEPKLPTATQVRNYLSALQDFCEKNHIGVIGTVGSPKAKPGDKYLSPRERISGTAWWGRMTETILVIEPAQEEDQNSTRNLFVLPRNGKNEQHQFKFENGRLEQVSGLAYRTAREHIVGYLNRPEVRPHFKKADLVRELGLVSTTASNAVDKLVKEEAVRKLDHGMYEWVGLR